MRYNLLFFIGWFLVSCSESEIASDTDRIGLNYFPLEVGDYRIYDVVETNYTVLEAITDIYELKESVVDSNYNSSNNLQYIIHRSTRVDDSEIWNLDSIWTAQKSTNIAVLTENNVPFVKLSFPISHQLEWDGNGLNTLESEIYWYDTELPDTVLLEVPYQNLVKVVQNDRGEDFLGFEDKSEIFAPDVGLIIKESTLLQYCQTECETEKEIQSGRAIKMTLKEYGKE
ncbi:MAG: hypothetical protein ABJH98_07545 [Reichenbachiella sp.]|uniref:hypothetical protein n=1 Tax=Reichenbachiella sp. TaxID=2184521 RepID=UPI003297E0A2